MWKFIVEILIHSSFFLAFLTVFYMTFFVFVQNMKLSKEISDMFEQFGYINLIGSFSSRNELQNLKNEIQNYNIDASPVDNSKLIYFVTIIVSSVCCVLIGISFIICYFQGINIIQLVYTNLITIMFIAITDIFIVLFFSVFKVIQPGFLFGIILSGNQFSSNGIQSSDCEKILRDGLDEVFPAFKSLIDNSLKG